MVGTNEEVSNHAFSNQLQFYEHWDSKEQRKASLRKVEMDLDEADEMVSN